MQVLVFNAQGFWEYSLVSPFGESKAGKIPEGRCPASCVELLGPVPFSCPSQRGRAVNVGTVYLSGNEAIQWVEQERRLKMRAGMPDGGPRDAE